MVGAPHVKPEDVHTARDPHLERLIEHGKTRVICERDDEGTLCVAIFYDGHFIFDSAAYASQMAGVIHDLIGYIRAFPTDSKEPRP